MILTRTKTVCVPKEKIQIDERELARRLGGASAQDISIIGKCVEQFEKNVDYKYCALLTTFERNGDFFDIGFGEFESKSLSRNLENSDSIFIFAATLGVGIDRLIKRLSVYSPAEQYVTDAVSSAAVESLCDYVENELVGDKEHRPRFSPGYGDLPLAIQPEVLSMLNAEKTMGITLTDALLMIPSKSVTAFIGVKNENF